MQLRLSLFYFMPVFNKFFTILLVGAASSIFASEALAQTEPTESSSQPQETVAEAFDRAFFKHSGDSFEAGRIPAQINLIFGFSASPEGSFPENQIARDAREIDILYKEGLKQQNQSQPMIRTRDLSNPFDSSVLNNPTYLLPR